MRKTRPLLFLSILAAILLVMSLPRAFSEKSRGALVSLFSPLWEQTDKFKQEVNSLLGGDAVASHEMSRLYTENQVLTRELRHLQEIIRQELYLTRSGAHRSGQWQKLVDAYTEALPARVIFRNPSSWNSSCWLNVGHHHNQKLGKHIIAKNSPVVVGYSLVGVIDFVGAHQSRVRLITDSGLTPSVRAVRGEPKQRQLSTQLNMVMDALMDQDTLFASAEEKIKTIDQLEELEKKLQAHPSSLYLAKGVLTGSSQPAWRRQGLVLKGTGFNCDFADSVSPIRDLITGAAVGGKDDTHAILKEKDLLITTGMDGVFPAGLHVAEVIKIYPLKEGDYFYELEALPVAGELDDLSLVYILPPVGYDPEEEPPLMGWE